MDFSWLAEPTTWIGLITLVVLEIVLGVDNLVFVAILSNKASPKNRDRARVVGLCMAVVIRIVMLGLMSFIITFTKPFMYLGDYGVSVKDLIMLGGGLFLLYKATTELHERLEGHQALASMGEVSVYTGFWSVVIQIVILDAVFSLDSVITAVAMVQHITVAMLAVIIAMGMMIWASRPLTDFVGRHPTVVMLCLGFLLMIGFSLIADGLHFEIPKGYLYAAIAFSILIEIFNQISSSNSRRNDMTSRTWRYRTAENVLGMMGLREKELAKNGDETQDEEHFEENEKSMIRSVLTLAERPIMGVMTPRNDIERLDISQSKSQQDEQLQQTPFSRLIVVGRAGIDEPLGYVSKKDLLNQLLTLKKLDIQEALRQPLVLPDSSTVLDAMELFRSSSANIALVVDEFGAVLGLVTMKDVMETIAGDFPEEYERSDAPSIQENADHSITVDGSLEYATLAQYLQLPTLPEDANYHTVAGLMMEEMQDIPAQGDTIDYAGYRFEVLNKEGHRIERVRISKIPVEED
ncbi:TerC family protein [Neisseriaceae bacterium ESL0693]|nr:TerC family protein [Neisseriaceae bacterium ESL0693]